MDMYNVYDVSINRLISLMEARSQQASEPTDAIRRHDESKAREANQ